MRKLTIFIIPTLLYIFSTLIQTNISLDPHLLQKLIFLGIIAIFTALIISFAPKNIIQSPLFIFIIFAINTLILLGIFLFGPHIAHTKRWLQLGTFTYQPSEFFKFIFIALLSLIYTQPKKTSIKNYIKFLGIFILPIILIIFLQPDAGNAIILSILVGGLTIKSLSYKYPDLSKQIIISTSLTLSYLLALINHIFVAISIGLLYLWRKYLKSPLVIGTHVLLLLGMMSILLYHKLPLHEYQKQRIETTTVLFTSYKKLSQALDKQETLSFNLKQSRIAIGSGGFFGKGLKNITQSRLKFLPEYRTDFIYATISEAFGFVGATTIIVMYILQAFLLLQIDLQQKDKHLSLLIFGFNLLLLTEVTINIGGNLGLLPTKGIPLPFLGYGGSSLITHFLILGYIANHIHTT